MNGLLLLASVLIISIHQVLCNASGKCADSQDVGEPLLLTPFINNGSLEMAKDLSKFTIHGWAGYSGFLTVNKNCGGHIYFVFVPAKNNPQSAPLFLWLNGGPGHSSMFGFLAEIGPFKYINASYIEPSSITWNDNNHILYIDQPIGTGFSFPKNSCLAENISVSTEQLYSGLVQFFKLFPEYRENKFHITGQSFAGHYIPILAVFIHNQNQMYDVEVKMNLVGTLIGNPTTRLDCRNYAHFLYMLGFVGVELRDVLDGRHRELVGLIEKEKFVEAHNYWLSTLDLIDSQTYVTSFYNVLSDTEDTLEYWTWLDTPEARCQLNVGNITFQDLNDDVYNKFVEDVPKSPLFAHYIETLLEANYSMVFYSGNLELTSLTASTDCLVRGLSWWGAEGFRKANRMPWLHSGTLAGYLQHFGKLAFIVINNAGRSVPFYQPGPMKDVIDCINFPCEDDPFCNLDTVPLDE